MHCPNQPFVIALTGGIACGKTTVARLFEHLGVQVIYADQIAYQLTDHHLPENEKTLSFIKQHFGTDVFFDNGSLNRLVLKKIIFENPEDKFALEQILHPLIFKAMQYAISASQSPFLLLEIPLLFEHPFFQTLVQRILTVELDSVDEQVNRLIKRDNISRSLSLQIINAQSNREQRERIAHNTIFNNTNECTLKYQIQELYRVYSSMATSIDV